MPSLNLEILLHVLADYFYLALRSFAELVDDKMSVVTTKVVKEDRDSETDRTLRVTLAVSGSEEESSDVIVITDLRPLRIVLHERVAADVALRRVLVFLPLLGAQLLHWSIGSELLDDRSLPLDEDVSELGKCIFFDLHH